VCQGLDSISSSPHASEKLPSIHEEDAQPDEEPNAQEPSAFADHVFVDEAIHQKVKHALQFSMQMAQMLATVVTLTVNHMNGLKGELETCLEDFARLEDEVQRSLAQGIQDQEKRNQAVTENFIEVAQAMGREVDSRNEQVLGLKMQMQRDIQELASAAVRKAAKAPEALEESIVEKARNIAREETSKMLAASAAEFQEQALSTLGEKLQHLPLGSLIDRVSALEDLSKTSTCSDSSIQGGSACYANLHRRSQSPLNCSGIADSCRQAMRNPATTPPSALDSGPGMKFVSTSPLQSYKATIPAESIQLCRESVESIQVPALVSIANAAKMLDSSQAGTMTNNPSLTSVQILPSDGNFPTPLLSARSSVRCPTGVAEPPLSPAGAPQWILRGISSHSPVRMDQRRS
jgi:hypothetical protein